jgi:hypothetical protein
VLNDNIQIIEQEITMLLEAAVGEAFEYADSSPDLSNGFVTLTALATIPSNILSTEQRVLS